MTTALPTETLDERPTTVKAPQVHVYLRQSLDSYQQQIDPNTARRSASAWRLPWRCPISSGRVRSSIPTSIDRGTTSQAASN